MGCTLPTLARDIEIVVIDGCAVWQRLVASPVLCARTRQSPEIVDAAIVNGGVARAGEIPMQLAPDWR